MCVVWLLKQFISPNTLAACSLVMPSWTLRSVTGLLVLLGIDTSCVSHIFRKDLAASGASINFSRYHSAVLLMRVCACYNDASMVLLQLSCKQTLSLRIAVMQAFAISKDAHKDDISVMPETQKQGQSVYTLSEYNA